MLLQYLYTISKLLCFDIEFRVLPYRCFCRIQPGLPTRYWTEIAVCTLHCESIITRGSCAARAALSRRSGGCTRRRGHTRCTGRSTGRSHRSGARAGIYWRQVCGRRSGGCSRRSGHRRNAGACDSSRHELTGAKFGMMIWRRISGSCLGLLQTKRISNINEDK